jgi:TPR repeat protein
MYQNGEGMPKSKVSAIKFFKKGCDLGHEKSCEYANKK